MEGQSPLVCSHQHLLLSALWVLPPDPDEESVICRFCFYWTFLNHGASSGLSDPLRLASLPQLFWKVCFCTTSSHTNCPASLPLFHRNSLWRIPWGGKGWNWRREFELIGNWLSFPPCSGVEFCSNTLEKFNSHFLSATYLSSHVVLQLGDLFISLRHTTLCSFCRGHLDPSAGPLTNFAFKIQVPNLRLCPPFPSVLPVWPGGKVLSCLETSVFLQGQMPITKMELITCVLPASWGG